MAFDLAELEGRLWVAADELRANSTLKASEYSVPVLGLIFLKFAEVRFPEGGARARHGNPDRTQDAAAMRRAGLAYIPDERMRDGVVATFSVAENLMLMDHARPAYRRHGFFRLKAIRRHAGAWSTIRHQDPAPNSDPIVGEPLQVEVPRD